MPSKKQNFPSDYDVIYKGMVIGNLKATSKKEAEIKMCATYSNSENITVELT